MRELKCSIMWASSLALALVACGAGGGDEDGDGPADAQSPDAQAPDGHAPDAQAPDAQAPDAQVPDAQPSGNAGFVAPTVTTGPADWSCLGTADDTPATTLTIAVSGRVHDFQTTSQALGDATVEAFSGPDPANLVATDGPTGPTGMYAVDVPAGARRWGFRVTAPGYVETWLLHYAFEPAIAAQSLDLAVVSEALATALPAFVGATRELGAAQVAVRVVDCTGAPVSGAIVTTSTTPGVVAHLGATTTYYTDGGSSLPVGHGQRMATDGNGVAFMFDVTPRDSAFIQAWGYPTDSDLTSGDLVLLGELGLPVHADTFVTADVPPRRTP